MFIAPPSTNIMATYISQHHWARYTIPRAGIGANNPKCSLRRNAAGKNISLYTGAQVPCIVINFISRRSSDYTKGLKVSQTAPYSLIRRGINLRNGGHRFLLFLFLLPTNPFLRWGGTSRVFPAFFHRPDMSFRTILALIDLRFFLLVRRRRNNRSYHGLRRTRDRCFQRLNSTRQGPILL